LKVNDGVLETLVKTFHDAIDADEQGIANFLAERIDMHEKWRWQLKASTK
jgi:DNA-binding ferritin-like protein